MHLIFVAPHSPQAVGYKNQQEFIEYAEYHHQYCRELTHRGHKVEFWHFGPEYSCHQHEFGHKIRQFKSVNLPILNTELSPSMYVELLRADFDLIHFHSLHSMENWIPYSILNVKGENIVAQNHGPELDSTKNVAQILYKALDILLPSDSAILSVNKGELKNLQNHISAEEFRYLPNGVNVDKYSPIDKCESRKILGLQEDEDYVLYVGRVTQSKGVKYLINAMESVSATLLLVYGGADEKLLQELQSADPSNVEFIGAVDNRSLVRYYDAADVCAFPSVSEGFGVVCLESMATQTATIGTEAHLAGEQNHLIDGENSLVTEKKSSQSLSKAISKLLSNDHFRGQIAVNGRNHVIDKFSWETVGSKLEKVYKNVVDD